MKKSNYTEKVAIKSTLLGSLLSQLNKENLGSINFILQDEGVTKFFADEELVHTVEVFFENNLNLIKASNSLIVHRNTLLYRLEKIKKMIGLDIRNFEDAVTLQAILILKRTEVKRKRQENKTVRLESLNKK